MKISNRKLFTHLLPLALVFTMNACIHTEDDLDNDKLQNSDGLAAELPKDVKAKHEFEVDKESGKIEFKTPVVYFEFDAYTLTPEGQERLQVLAEYLMKNNAQKLAVEGHADARGSHEYNLALGQSRAEAVQKYLIELGVDRERLNSLSYGEEKPAKEGAGEEAWSKNRRAEFTLLASK